MSAFCIPVNRKLQYPSCVWCGQLWQKLEDEDPDTARCLWCCNDHETLWYFPDNTSAYTCIQREVDGLNGRSYIINWYSDDQVPTIGEHDDYDTPHWYIPNGLPFNATHQELELIIAQPPDFYE
jgi:hypothetical protein